MPRQLLALLGHFLYWAGMLQQLLLEIVLQGFAETFAVQDVYSTRSFLFQEGAADRRSTKNAFNL